MWHVIVSLCVTLTVFTRSHIIFPSRMYILFCQFYLVVSYTLNDIMKNFKLIHHEFPKSPHILDFPYIRDILYICDNNFQTVVISKLHLTNPFDWRENVLTHHRFYTLEWFKLYEPIFIGAMWCVHLSVILVLFGKSWACGIIRFSFLNPCQSNMFFF